MKAIWIIVAVIVIIIGSIFVGMIIGKYEVEKYKAELPENYFLQKAARKKEEEVKDEKRSK